LFRYDDAQCEAVCLVMYFQCLSCRSSDSWGDMEMHWSMASDTDSTDQGFTLKAPLSEGEQPTNSDTTRVDLLVPGAESGPCLHTMYS